MPDAAPVRRWWIALPLAASAVWIWLRNDAFRSVEARAFAPLVSLVTGGHDAVAANSIIWFSRDTAHPPLGLDVTSECTTAVLILPLIAVMGAFAVFSRIPLRRTLGALGAGIALLVVTNAVRVAGIAFATDVWGTGAGYEYSHVFAGSAFALIGFVASIVVAVWLLVRGRPVDTAAVHRPTRSAIAVDELSAFRGARPARSEHAVGGTTTYRSRHLDPTGTAPRHRRED